MISKVLSDFFGMDKNEIENFISGSTKIMSRVLAGNATEESEETNEKKDPKMYFNTNFKTTGVRYDNGELVERFEKEYVNGECTKDTHYSKNLDNVEHEELPNTPSDDTCGDECCVAKKTLGNRHIQRHERFKREINRLREINEANRNQINEMTSYIDGLNDKIKKLAIENERLKSIIDNVKKCF